MFGSVNTPGASAVERKKAEAALLARIESLEKSLSGNEKIPGVSEPTSQVTAKVGQIYINVITGEEWKCVEAGESGTVWEPRSDAKINLDVFAAGTAPPSDTKLLWIDTTANTGGLKYWDGSAWVAVPVGYV